MPIPGAHRPGLVTKAGLILFGNDDKMVRGLHTAVSHLPAFRPQASLEETGRTKSQGKSRNLSTGWLCGGGGGTVLFVTGWTPCVTEILSSSPGLALHIYYQDQVFKPLGLSFPLTEWGWDSDWCRRLLGSGRYYWALPIRIVAELNEMFLGTNHCSKAMNRPYISSSRAL